MTGTGKTRAAAIDVPAVLATAPALLGLLLVHLVAVKQYDTLPVKEQFREAAAFLVAHDAPDSAAMVSPAPATAPTSTTT